METSKTLILDTETTGILAKDPDTEACQISIVNTSGKPVFNMMIDPGRPIPYEVYKIHGIDTQQLTHSPSFGDVAPILQKIIKDKHLVAYNAEFDIHLLTHLLTKYGFDVPEFDTTCCMEAYARWVGDWSSVKNDWKWQKLPKLAYGSAHDSLTDALSTLTLIKRMAGDFSDEVSADDIDISF